MDAKEFLKEKKITNNDFMDDGVADLIESLLTEYHSLQLHKTQVSGSVCDKDDDFEPIIKHFRSEDTSQNWDDKPMGGFSDW